jgi:hypothetical protein
MIPGGCGGHATASSGGNTRDPSWFRARAPCGSCPRRSRSGPSQAEAVLGASISFQASGPTSSVACSKHSEPSAQSRGPVGPGRPLSRPERAILPRDRAEVESVVSRVAVLAFIRPERRVELPPAVEKWRRGLLVAVLVAAGLLLAVVGGLALTIGPDLRRFATGSKRLIDESLSAPGVRELTASVCRHAIVRDLDAWHRLGTQVDPSLPARSNPGIRVGVTCYVDRPSEAPSCDGVAATYRRAVGPSQALNAVVRLGRSRDASRLLCSRAYAASGEPLGEITEE